MKIILFLTFIISTLNSSFGDTKNFFEEDKRSSEGIFIMVHDCSEKVTWYKDLLVKNGYSEKQGRSGARVLCSCIADFYRDKQIVNPSVENKLEELVDDKVLKTAKDVKKYIVKEDLLKEFKPEKAQQYCFHETEVLLEKQYKKKEKVEIPNFANSNEPSSFAIYLNMHLCTISKIQGKVKKECACLVDYIRKKFGKGIISDYGKFEAQNPKVCEGVKLK